MAASLVASPEEKLEKSVATLGALLAIHPPKTVKTTSSLLEQLLPKHIHAVTAADFELKVAPFLLALSFTFLFKAA
jgi:hypothetical protein